MQAITTPTHLRIKAELPIMAYPNRQIGTIKIDHGSVWCTRIEATWDSLWDWNRVTYWMRLTDLSLYLHRFERGKKPNLFNRIDSGDWYTSTKWHGFDYALVKYDSILPSDLITVLEWLQALIPDEVHSEVCAFVPNIKRVGRWHAIDQDDRMHYGYFRG